MRKLERQIELEMQDEYILDLKSMILKSTWKVVTDSSSYFSRLVGHKIKNFL